MPAKSRPMPTVEETLQLPRLTVVSKTEKTPGRKKKLEAPPPPQEILDAMSEVERAFFDTFVEGSKERYKDLTELDIILLYLAGFELVQLLRMHLKQMIDGELISQARQHPGVQFRQYIDMLSVARKSRPASKPADAAEDILAQLSGRAA